jgi:hypothetical protein
MDPEDRYPRLDLCRGKSPWDVLSLTATSYAHAQQNLKTGDFHKHLFSHKLTPQFLHICGPLLRQNNQGLALSPPKAFLWKEAH